MNNDLRLKFVAVEAVSSTSYSAPVSPRAFAPVLLLFPNDRTEADSLAGLEWREQRGLNSQSAYQIRIFPNVNRQGAGEVSEMREVFFRTSCQSTRISYIWFQ